MSDDDGDVKALYDSAFALRDTIFRLRGRIVSEVNGVEASLDLALATYFVDTERMQNFRIWILARIQLAEKIKVLDEIVNDVGIAALVQGTMQGLRDASELRNDQAHSNVSVNPNVESITPDTRQQVLQWHSMSVTRRGLKATRIEIEKLERAVERSMTRSRVSTRKCSASSMN